ncbi:Fibronectin type III domain protein [Actinobacteria bacterium OK074]|nr:Fibronectin type III domain protein [Actinobacteria bacterium OK074]
MSPPPHDHRQTYDGGRRHRRRTHHHGHPPHGHPRNRRHDLRLPHLQTPAVREHHLQGHPETNRLRRHRQRELGHQGPCQGPPQGQLRRPLDRHPRLRLRRALTAAALDGIRVYVDGVRRIDLWKNVTKTQKKTLNLTVPKGRHTLRVDYASWTGSAAVTFAYTPRTAATVDKTEPLAPTGAKATYSPTTNTTKLTWAKNKEMDLAGYRVYRRPATSTTWAKLATATATTYTDTPPATGQSYAYEIRAYDKAGNESAGTADQSVTTVDRPPPAVPTGLTTDGSYTKGLHLDWTAVADAVSYRIYRAASAGAALVEVGRTDAVSYLDTSAEEEVAYYYRVSAVDAAGNESAPSATVADSREDLTPPSAVTGLVVTPTEYGFAMEWDPNPTPDLTRYVVYGGVVLGEEGEQQVCSVHDVAWLYTATTSYDYATLPDGDERCFFVDAIDDAGNSQYKWTRSPNIVVATKLDTTPSVATPDGSPLTLDAVPDGADDSLTWTTTEATAPAGYRVYRWNPATAAYERIAETDGSRTYRVENAPRGTASYYWVTAVAADGTESLPAGDYTVTAPRE